jgi:hypothetical protein
LGPAARCCGISACVILLTCYISVRVVFLITRLCMVCVFLISYLKLCVFLSLFLMMCHSLPPFVCVLECRFQIYFSFVFLAYQKFVSLCILTLCIIISGWFRV